MVNKAEKSNEQPLVSFVVNCYNGESYLKKCLDSIIEQTYCNWELIFWDNCSTDNSCEIFQLYKDARFKYFRSSENVNLGQARAWAVEKCTGDYLAFLDVDDRWYPEKTKIQIEGMIQMDAVLSYAGVSQIVEETNESKIFLPKYSSGNIFKENLSQFEINMPTSVIKRSALIEKSLNFDPIITASEEYCLFMQLIIDEKVFVVQAPLAQYTLRKNSLTSKMIDRWAFERRYTLEKILQRNSKLQITYKKEFEEAFFRADYYEVRYLMYKNNNELARSVLKKAAFQRIRYFILYILLFFPSGIWNYIHLHKNKRI